MSMWMMYCFTRLDSLVAFFIVTAVCLGIVIVIAALGFTLEGCDWIKRYGKMLIIAFVSSILAACLIPNTKEAAAIYLLPKIANNEQVQQIPDKAMQLLNGKLDEWIADFRKDKK